MSSLNASPYEPTLYVASPSASLWYSSSVLSFLLSARKLLGTLADSTTDSNDADLNEDVDGKATHVRKHLKMA